VPHMGNMLTVITDYSLVNSHTVSTGCAVLTEQKLNPVLWRSLNYSLDWLQSS